MRQKRETLKPGRRMAPEFVDLARRRTIEFLLQGTHLPIQHVLQEAYFQGIRDAMEVMQ